MFPWLSEDVALTIFFHPLFSVCVFMWTCLCIVRSSFKMHIHTLVHTCILPKLTQPVCRTPNHDYKLKCEELFFFFSFALFYTFTIFVQFLVSTRRWNAGVLYVLPQIWDFTHCREVLWWKKGDLIKHKLNQGFVPNCYMFSIWHLSKLLYMRNIYCKGLLMCMSNYF